MAEKLTYLVVMVTKLNYVILFVFIYHSMFYNNDLLLKSGYYFFLFQLNKTSLSKF